MKPYRIKPAIPLIFYGLLAGLIMGPLLKPGYIFLLDYVAGPHIFFDFNPTYVNSIPFDLLVRALSVLVTPMLAQKLIIFLTLFAIGTAIHYSVEVRFKAARYFAGFFYVVNPFVFTRLQAGHIGLLVIYALTPLAVRSLLRFLDYPDRRAAVRAGAWIAGLAIIALHGLYMFLILGIGIVVFCWTKRSLAGYATNLLKGLGILIAVFLALSAFWLIPAGLVTSPVAGIDARQIAAFATRGDPSYGLYINVAALYGFWQTQLFEAKTVMAIWPGLFLVLFALAIWGLNRGLNNEKRRQAIMTIGLTSVIGFVLALGISSPVTSGIYRFLFDHVAAFRGFREPQKFAGLLAFGYAYLGSIGLDDVIRRAQNRLKTIADKLPEYLLAFLVTAVAAAFTWPMFWGLSGHVKSVDYPGSWYAVEHKLAKKEDQGKVLFLPWHQYLSLSFNDPDKVVANPARVFFTADVVSGENMELGRVETVSADPAQRKVAGLISDGVADKEVRAGLSSLGIGYVILAKESDWRKYRWLDRQAGLRKVYETRQIVLFEVL